MASGGPATALGSYRGHQRFSRRTPRAAALGGVLVGVGVLLGGAGGGAQAAVVSSSPAPNQHLQHAPAQVSILFDQPVIPEAGGLAVLNSSGASVLSGPGQHPRPNTLTASLDGNLPDGAYVANYTVTSVDGHIVNGAVVFLVGHATAGSIGQLVRQQSTPIDVVDKFGQFLIYLGVLGVGGLVFFVAFILDNGPERRLLRRLTLIGVATAAAGMVITVVAQSALAGGGDTSILRWSVLRPVLAGGFGRQCLVQVIGLALCVYSLSARAQIQRQFAALYGMVGAEAAFVLFGHAIAAPNRWLTVPADIVHVIFAALWIGGLIGLITVLWSRTRRARYSGERPAGEAEVTLSAVSGVAASPLSFTHSGRSALHDDAGRTTAGQPRGRSTAVMERSMGSEAIATTVDRSMSHESEPAEAAEGTDGTDQVEPVLFGTVRIVRRFSSLAGISVSLVVVAGTLLAIGLVGSFANLVNTTYGRLLLVKIGAVGLILFMAAYNRFLLLPWLLPRDAHGASGADTGAGLLRANGTPTTLGQGWRMLLRTIRVEAALVVVVLSLTAVITNSTPGTSAVVTQRPIPFHQVQSFEGGTISLRITPNQALVNNVTVHLLDHQGRPFQAQSVSVFFTLPSLNVGPIIVDMKKVGVGQFELSNTPNPPIVGDWQVTLQVRVSDFDEQESTYVDQVKG